MSEKMGYVAESGLFWADIAMERDRSHGSN